MGETIFLGSNRKTKAIWVLVGLAGLVLCNTNVLSSMHRSLSESARLLCNTMFNYPDWKQYWEDLFFPKTVYTGIGDRSLLPRGPKNIGYFLIMPSCPADGYPAGDPHDPGKLYFSST